MKKKVKTSEKETSWGGEESRGKVKPPVKTSLILRLIVSF